MVTVAKGIASGLPLGVTTARAEVMTWPPGAHASTFGGNPVSCAAALATIELLRDVAGEERGRGRRAPAWTGCARCMDKHPLIGDVRGKGLMIGVELVRDRDDQGARAPTERDGVVDEAFTRGMLDPRRRPQRRALLAAAGADQGAGRHRGPDLRRVPDGGGEGLIELAVRRAVASRIATNAQRTQASRRADGPEPVGPRPCTARA